MVVPCVWTLFEGSVVSRVQEDTASERGLHGIKNKGNCVNFCIFFLRFWDSDLVSSVKDVSPAAVVASSFQRVALDDAASADSSADDAASKVCLVARVAWAAGVSKVGEFPAGRATRTGESWAGESTVRIRESRAGESTVRIGESRAGESTVRIGESRAGESTIRIGESRAGETAALAGKGSAVGGSGKS